MSVERVLFAMGDLGEVYADRWVDADGRAWLAPCGTPTPDADPAFTFAWEPETTESPS